jgi:hypothetical protein
MRRQALPILLSDRDCYLETPGFGRMNLGEKAIACRMWFKFAFPSEAGGNYEIGYNTVAISPTGGVAGLCART